MPQSTETSPAWIDRIRTPSISDLPRGYERDRTSTHDDSVLPDTGCTSLNLMHQFQQGLLNIQYRAGRRTERVQAR